MNFAVVKSDSSLAAMPGDCYNNTFCDSKSHAERVHFGCFYVRDNLEYAGEVAGCECFRLFHVFVVLTLFPLRLVQ